MSEQSTAETQFSRQTLEDTPPRALTFLSAIFRRPAIRAAMEERGYTSADHQEGWRLLHATTGYDHTPHVPEIDPVVRDAVVSIDRWDEPNLAIARAALVRKHPAQAQFVFENLSAAEGAASVVSTEIFLERLDQLENSPARRATRTDDHAALKTLEARGITKEERQRVAKLVQTAKGIGLAAKPVAAPKDHTAELIELKRWYDDWATVARNVIKRRDHLILLGLARRKPRAGPEEHQEGPAEA